MNCPYTVRVFNLGGQPAGRTECGLRSHVREDFVPSVGIYRWRNRLRPIHSATFRPEVPEGRRLPDRIQRRPPRRMRRLPRVRRLPPLKRTRGRSRASRVSFKKTYRIFFWKLKTKNGAKTEIIESWAAPTSDSHSPSSLLIVLSGCWAGGRKWWRGGLASGSFRQPHLFSR